MTIWLLPTLSPVEYRGKYPTRARMIGSTRTGGRHIELNNGKRLWSIDDRTAEYGAGSLRDDYAAVLARAVPMTDEQYQTLKSAMELLATRIGLAGRTKREALEVRVRAILETIQPAPTTVYLVAVSDDGADVDLCEGGVYSDTAPADSDYGADWNVAAAYVECARLNASRKKMDFRTCYEIRDSMAGVRGPDVDVAGSLEPWQLALIASQAPATVEPGYTRAPSSYAPGTPEAAQAEAAAASFSRVLFGEPETISPVRRHLQLVQDAPTIHLRQTRGPDGQSVLMKADETATGIRRDNVEYHKGKAARERDEPESACPYLAGERAARWALGWREGTPPSEDFKAGFMAGLEYAPDDRPEAYRQWIAESYGAWMETRD